jgi:hypothetical protein
MRGVIGNLVLCGVLAGLAGCADAPGPRADLAVGRVDGVYVKMAPGLYLSTRLAGMTTSGDTWVRVQAMDARGDMRPTMAHVDPATPVEPGRWVMIRDDAPVASGDGGEADRSEIVAVAPAPARGILDVSRPAASALYAGYPATGEPYW